MSACYVAAGHVTFLARRVKSGRGSVRGCDVTVRRCTCTSVRVHEHTTHALRHRRVLKLGCRGDAESGRRLRVCQSNA